LGYLYILQPDAAPRPQALSRFFDALQETRVVLDHVIDRQPLAEQEMISKAI
jgi:hypothetical protein